MVSEGPSGSFQPRRSTLHIFRVLLQQGLEAGMVAEGEPKGYSMPRAGLEPARELLPGDFKSPVSTDSTTPALPTNQRLSLTRSKRNPFPPPEGLRVTCPQ